MTAVAGYRQPPDGTQTDAIGDVALAVTWLQRHAVKVGGAPSCTVVIGHSAGALLAAHLAYDPQHLRGHGGKPVHAVALLGGLYDPEALLPHLDGDDAEGFQALYGRNKVARARWDVLRRVQGGIAPTLVLAGTKEEPSLQAQFRAMVGVLQATGAPHESALLTGEDHMDLVPVDAKPVLDRLKPWLAAVAARCKSLP